MGWVQSEEAAQRALFEWAALYRARVPELALLFHVPNGGWRHPTVAAKLQAMGVKRGVPDVWFPVQRCGYVGLVIEMKTPTRRNCLTPEQKAWLEALREHGWATAVETTWVGAANTITLYLRGELRINEVA